MTFTPNDDISIKPNIVKEKIKGLNEIETFLADLKTGSNGIQQLPFYTKENESSGPMSKEMLNFTKELSSSIEQLEKLVSLTQSFLEQHLETMELADSK